MATLTLKAVGDNLAYYNDFYQLLFNSSTNPPQATPSKIELM